MAAQEAVRFHLPPLKRAAATCSVADLDAWLARAAAGHLCVYATGEWVDPSSAIAAHVAALAKAGRVRTHLRGHGAERQHLIAKLNAGHALDARGAALGHGITVDGTPLLLHADTNTGRVYALLERAARAGDPCPTNREIALALALRDEQAAGHLVRRLRAAGHIAIEDRGPRLTRIVTITATAKRTCASRVKVGVGFERSGGVK